MCLAIPGKVISICDGKAIVDYSGQKAEAIVKGIDVKPGDYVLVQFKVVTQVISEKDALDCINGLRGLC